jgi:hypothetical protein
LRFLKFSSYNLYMPNGVSTDQWFLEVNGKKFGPYTMAQINALVRHHEIVGEDKVTASHLSGKWITVQEFVSQNEPTINIAAPSAPKASVVPPRPDERTLTSIIAPSHHSHEPRKSDSSDAVLNLFEILQAARERKTQNQTPTTVGHSVIEMPRPVKSSSGAGLFWLAVPAMVVVAVAAWKMTGSTPAPAPVAETVTPAQATAQTHAQAPAPKSAPTTASVPAAKPAQTRNVASTSLPVRAKAVSVSASIAPRQALRPAPVVNDRERERELEREREREAERELEREKERDKEYARNGAGDSNESSRGERERERESERDHRDSRDSRDPRDRSPASNNDNSNSNSNGNNSSGDYRNGSDSLVTGGTPADAGAFRDNPDSSRSGPPQFQ